jgi:hypothetical protein
VTIMPNLNERSAALADDHDSLKRTNWTDSVAHPRHVNDVLASVVFEITRKYEVCRRRQSLNPESSRPLDVCRVAGGAPRSAQA